MARAAQGSGSAEWIVLGVLVAVHCCSLPASSATHTVGGAQGWILNPSPNYATWAASQTFATGDVLFFPYTKGEHDVVEVNKAGYDACSAATPIASYTAGNTNVTLTSAGTHYFLCSLPGHCTAGMLVTVTVGGAAAAPAPTPANTTAPAPTPATTSPTPATTPPASTPATTSPTPVPSPVNVGTPVPAPASTSTPTSSPTSALTPSPASESTPTPASASSPPSPGTPSSTPPAPPNSAPSRPSFTSLAAVLATLGGAFLAL